MPELYLSIFLDYVLLRKESNQLMLTVKRNCFVFSVFFVPFLLFLEPVEAKRMMPDMTQTRFF
jgi:hypothetical protein